MTGDHGTSAQQRSHIGNVLLPLAVLAVSAILFYLSFEFPDQGDVGAAAVPHLWIYCTALFCVALTVQGLRRKGAADPIPGHVGFVLLYAGWMVLYLLAIESVGYYASTFVFLLGSMRMMGYRRPIIATAVAASWLVFSHLVFAELLYIPLPVGPLMEPLLGSV